MSIVPEVTGVSGTKAEDNSDDDDATPTFDDRNDDQEQYWANVNCYRAINKIMLDNDVAVTENGGIFAKKAENESPLAALGVQLYNAKDELGTELTERRKSDEWDDDMTLPNYKEQFGTPEWKHTKVTAENADEEGFNSEFFDDDEVLFIPADFGDLLPTNDGGLVVWYDTDENSPEPATVSKAAVLESLNNTEGVGQKSAGRILNQLQADGIIEISD